VEDTTIIPLAQFMDIIFILDILITFNIGYKKGPILHMKRSAIVLQYLKTWLLIDVIAAVTYVPSCVVGQRCTLNILHLVRLLRVLRFGRMLARVTNGFQINSVALETYKFFYYVFVLAHTLACCFIWMNMMTMNRYSSTWVSAKFGTDYFNVQFTDLYTMAMYWAMTTMTTIGFGDVTPQNTEEIWFTIFAEVLGLSVFALLLNNINDFNERVISDKTDVRTQDAKNSVLTFLGKHQVNKKLANRVMQDLKFRQFLGEQSELFELPLSESIKSELKIATVSPQLMKIPLFGRTEDDTRELHYLLTLYNNLDVDSSKTLCHAEISSLMQMLGLHAAEAATAVQTMDLTGSGDISFTEFYTWFYIYKHGRPALKWPIGMIEAMAYNLKPVLFSADDTVVTRGTYGQTLYIMLDFGAVSYDNAFETKYMHARIRASRSMRLNSQGEVEKTSTGFSYDSHMPTIGLPALLSGQDAERCKSALQYDNFVVKASEVTYAMCLEAERCQNLMQKYWKEGSPHVLQLVAMKYGVDSLFDDSYVPQEVDVHGMWEDKDNNFARSAMYMHHITEELQADELDRQHREKRIQRSALSLWMRGKQLATGVMLNDRESGSGVDPSVQSLHSRVGQLEKTTEEILRIVKGGGK